MKSTEEIIARLRDRDNVHDGDVDEAADRLDELSKERAEMVAVWRQFREHGRVNGLTLREMAELLQVSPVTLSKWTATEPTTDPDFID
jgi:hypothetical protein